MKEGTRIMCSAERRREIKTRTDVNGASLSEAGAQGGKGGILARMFIDQERGSK